jgi:hypothetical protein
MVITDQGQSLRFWRASQLRLNDKIIRQFLQEKGWESTAPWKTAYSPGGDRYVQANGHRLHDVPTHFLNYREWIMEYFAIVMTNTYNHVTLVPNWLLYLITGALGSVIIGLLHRSPQTPSKLTSQPKPKVVVTEPVAAAASPKAETKRGGTKKKNGKK